MHIMNVNFTVANGGKRISNIRTAVTKRFDLRSGKHHARFIRIFNEVVMGSLFILCKHFTLSIILAHVLTPSP
ncbi:hypothetical protein D3C76_1565530 [compost metagenome]